MNPSKWKEQILYGLSLFSFIMVLLGLLGIFILPVSIFFDVLGMAFLLVLGGLHIQSRASNTQIQTQIIEVETVVDQTPTEESWQLLEGLKEALYDCHIQIKSKSKNEIEFVKILISHTQAIKAILYQNPFNDEMPFAYSFAIDHEHKKPLIKNEGLSGQVWASSQPYFLEELPKETHKIGSGLGQSYPRSMSIMPIFNSEGKVNAILELAFFQAWSVSQMKELYQILSLYPLDDLKTI